MYLVRSSSLLAAVAFAVLTISACSSETTIDAAESVVVGPTTEQVDQAAPAEGAAPDSSADAAAVEAPATSAPVAPAPVDETTSGGVVEIALSNGRSWTLETGDCYTELDSPFGVFSMSGANADGAELNVVESWPLDGDRTGGTDFIATFFDEDEMFYTAEGGPVTESNGTLSFESAVFEGLGLESTLTGTFSCTP